MWSCVRSYLEMVRDIGIGISTSRCQWQEIVRSRTPPDSIIIYIKVLSDESIIITRFRSQIPAGFFQSEEAGVISSASRAKFGSSVGTRKYIVPSAAEPPFTCNSCIIIIIIMSRLDYDMFGGGRVYYSNLCQWTFLAGRFRHFKIKIFRKLEITESASENQLFTLCILCLKTTPTLIWTCRGGN